MPLLDLKTSLKDLKFGTVAPYIQKDINNPGPASAGQIQARREDLSRLTKMLVDRPGVQFATNLAVLEASKTNFNNLVSLRTITNPARIIGNMLAQVPVNRTGTHFLSIDGALPTRFYTGNTAAASEALNSGTVTVPFKASNLARRTSSFVEYPDAPRTQFGSEAKNNAFVRLPSTGKDGTPTLMQKYSLADTKGGDMVNLFDIGKGSPTDDLMPVMFQLFGRGDTKLLFRGFLQNLSDTVNGNWQGVNYVGRMEQFFTYTGFTRTLSFQLVVPIFSQEEQPIVYNKLNSLMSFTAPTYNEGSNLPQGNIVSLIIGNYIRTHGFIGNISSTVDNNVPWSISSEGEYETTGTRLLPQVLTLNIQFTPIHEKAPQTYLQPHVKGDSNTPFVNHSAKPFTNLEVEPIRGLSTRETGIDTSTGTIQRQLPVGPVIEQGGNFLQNLGNLFRRPNRNRLVEQTENGFFSNPGTQTNYGGE